MSGPKHSTPITTPSSLRAAVIVTGGMLAGIAVVVGSVVLGGVGAIDFLLVAGMSIAGYRSLSRRGGVVEHRLLVVGLVLMIVPMVVAMSFGELTRLTPLTYGMFALQFVGLALFASAAVRTLPPDDDSH